MLSIPASWPSPNPKSTLMLWARRLNQWPCPWMILILSTFKWKPLLPTNLLSTSKIFRAQRIWNSSKLPRPERLGEEELPIWTEMALKTTSNSRTTSSMNSTIHSFLELPRTCTTRTTETCLDTDSSSSLWTMVSQKITGKISSTDNGQLLSEQACRSIWSLICLENKM